MSRGLVLGLLAVLTVAIGLATVGSARADTDRGHLSWGALQQGLISGTVITACSDGDFVSSTQAGVDRWNGALGRSTFQHYCAYPRVWVSTANFFDPDYGCGRLPDGTWPHACTRPTVFPPVGEEIVNPTYVRMNPDLFPGQGEYADGGTHTSRDITHELGHVLGHADYTGCPGGTPTVMDWTEVCGYDTPQVLDVTNYNDAYRPNGVAGFTGSSPGVGQVQLSWNPSNVHAEAEFRVNRWPAGQGCCGTEAGTAAKNASTITLSGQPYGRQTYRVRGWTYALNNGYGDNPAPGDVTLTVPGSNYDSDGDGFADWVEAYLGTDAYDRCPDNPSDDAWPLDIDKDTYITVTGDVFEYVGRIGAALGDPKWRQRLDLDVDGAISVTGDVFRYVGKIGAHCT